ncbi:MAG: DNA-binding response regulator [Alteromonadaceae bacterium]|nr:response regulator [Paraglaciecola agarilytica]AEE23112.1 two component transcriptional regulator, LuxR family [Glaciecola sp. 4H-3-7+YE-5]MBN24098.1 DNA-binding response regulator [Alteromonadaceae bacterium]|tara:strand:- start:3903 stop:4541 length:639 start_codon:yes stop_codon:yes gene_type:complete
MKDSKPPLSFEQVVHIIDDDEAVLDSLSMLLDSVDIKNAIYPNAQSFLSAHEGNSIQQLSGCIVLDIRMPGMSGMECQQRLEALKCPLPIIFITGHGDVPMAVEAMKKGAIEFIQKPFREQELLDCIHHALTLNKTAQKRASHSLDVAQRCESLTAREKEVMERVVAGLLNKTIANELNLSQRTIEIHRANMMEKMRVKSLAELMTLLLTKE